MSIEINDLSYGYLGAGGQALSGLNMSIRTASCFGLLGPNGAGKTTLISLLAGLLRPQQGSIRFNGESVVDSKRWGLKKLSLVPQECAFYPQLTIAENMQFFAGVQGLSAEQRQRQSMTALEVVGLDGVADRLAKQLSGGMQRRLNIAIALLNEPQILILDEPTVGIDPHSRRFILDAIKTISASGVTTIYTSHYMEEVEYLCDEVAILDQGQILCQGNLQALLGGARQLVLSLDRPLAQALSLPGSGRSLQAGSNRVVIDDIGEDSVAGVIAELQKQGYQVQQIHYGKKNLEDVFLELTGRHLRDAA